MKSFTLNSAKRFLRQINPFSRHGFHVSKIRHGRLDYLSFFLLHQHSGKITASILSMGTIAILLTSFSFANAAPSGNPPSSNVAPNFTGVNVVPTTDANDILSLKKNSADTGVILEQRFGAGVFDRNYLNFLGNGGLDVVAKGLGLESYTSLPIRAVNGYISLTAPNIYINGTLGNIDGSPLNLSTINNISTTNGGAVKIADSLNVTGVATMTGGVNIDSNLYVNSIRAIGSAVELFNKTYYHDNLLIDNSAIGFTGNNGYIRPEIYTSPAYDRTVARSGRLTDTCSYYKAGGNLNAKVYGYPLACAYQVAGNTSGAISVVTSTSPSGNACYYDWSTSSLSSSTTTYFLTTTLCYRGEFVGL